MRASVEGQAALDALTTRFCAAFGNTNGVVPDLDGLRDVFLPACVILHLRTGFDRLAETSVRARNSGRAVIPGTHRAAL